MDLDNTFWCHKHARREPVERDSGATLVGISRYGRCQHDAEPLETPDELAPGPVKDNGAIQGWSPRSPERGPEEKLEGIYSALRRMGKEIAELRAELRKERGKQGSGSPAQSSAGRGATDA